MSYAIKLKTAYDMSREAERKIRNTTGLNISLIVSEHDTKKTPAQLVELVGEALQLEEGYQLVRSRKSRYVDARFIAALLLKKHFPHITYTAIGKLFLQNHATIICALTSAGKLLETNDLLFTTKFLTAQKTVEQWIND